jgi:hypothetical protein
VELVSTVTNETLVVNVASSGEESDSGRTVEFSSDSGIDEMVGDQDWATDRREGIGPPHQSLRLLT